MFCVGLDGLHGGLGRRSALHGLLDHLDDVLAGEIVIVQAAFVRLPPDAEERRSLLERIRVAALARVGLAAGHVAAIGQALGEDHELAVDPLAQFQRDVADRLERRTAVAANDLLHGHGPVGPPAADTQDLVQPVRDVLIPDPGRVVSTAGEPAFGPLDAVLVEGLRERRVDGLLLCAGHGDAPRANRAHERRKPRLEMSAGPSPGWTTDAAAGRTTRTRTGTGCASPSATASFSWPRRR